MVYISESGGVRSSSNTYKVPAQRVQSQKSAAKPAKTYYKGVKQANFATSSQSVVKDSSGRDFLSFKDSNGTQLYEIDLNNPSYKYNYNNKRQLISVQINEDSVSNPGELIEIDYDDNNNVKSIVTSRDKGNEVIEKKEFKYDSNNRVLQARTEHPVTHNFESIVNYEYNKNGQYKLKETDLDNNLILESKYEAANRPTVTTYFEQVEGKDVPSGNIVYEYKDDGSYTEYTNDFKAGVLEQVIEYDRDGHFKNVTHPKTPIDVDKTIKNTFTKSEKLQTEDKEKALEIVSWIRKGVKISQADIAKAVDNNYKPTNDLDLRHELYRLAAIRAGVIEAE